MTVKSVCVFCAAVLASVIGLCVFGVMMVLPQLCCQQNWQWMFFRMFVAVFASLLGLFGLLMLLPQYIVEALPDSFAEHGGGPHWNVETQSLYMVDLPAGKIMRYDDIRNKMYKCKIENEQWASFIIPIKGSPQKFVVGTERRVSIVIWDGVSETCKVDETILTIEEPEYNRLNVAKCDPRGRLFLGTMHKTDFVHRTGNFYRLLKTDKLKVLKTDVGVSNGLAWNEKAKKFYYIDSEDYDVKEYDYDVKTGKIKNPKVIINFRNIRGDGIDLIPYGMTIDSEGYLYIAIFNGSAIYKVDPKSGKMLMEIKLPCEQITSAAFGGPDLSVLYVTTAAIDKSLPKNGITYKVIGSLAKGLPMTKIKFFNSFVNGKKIEYNNTHLPFPRQSKILELDI